MAETDDAMLGPADLCRRARALWARRDVPAAFSAAWSAFRLAPDSPRAKGLLVRLLYNYPDRLSADQREDFLRLLNDPEVEPNRIVAAGWHLLIDRLALSDDVSAAAFDRLAGELERDALPLALLRQAPVMPAAAERELTRLRRWLLLSRQWQRYPELVAALNRQAALNGGAWPFDEEERVRLGETESAPLRPAFLPQRLGKFTAALAEGADPVTRAVTAQYEGWPYPSWTRITRRAPSCLPDEVRTLDAALAPHLPIAARMLVAGCGSGRHAAAVASHFPDAAVTAVDVSEPSLDYARRQCASLGLNNVRFLRLDLHDVTALGQTFHSIHCGGVLHHLPDPERGWRALCDVLEPYGVMHIMLYNSIARLRIAGARKLVAELMEQPIDDDLLRRVRARLLRQADHPLAAHAVRSPDFATLAGTHDLLLHRHEDPFDLLRIGQALDTLGLGLLAFSFQSPEVEARYDAAFPQDPGHRNLSSLLSFERRNPGVFGNYRFWCCRPA